ncbi:DUF4381 domain-containing protein [Pseudoalteromonas sp. MMG012]|uniref:DUF4381 domain-containing protein n=1 Tax=Pseudoalteromonas sp. MMG012 TaxID=2822686 RepID=UPI001B3A0753|nr:DUF4381 domain-containing protein [Pseudoalteromonas sp. MMG012]MBQ4851743.1 DUF4381 family protein [Pseudoalteromonas sp. MMG012]
MQASPLDALHDVLPPSEVSWWPLSPVAWAALISTLLLIGLICRLLYTAQCHKQAKKQAINQSQLHQNDPQALHILLKRLAKHYYGTLATTQSQNKWASILSQLSEQTFNEQELNSLYAPVPNEHLAKKLSVAIRTFKLKEKVNV